MKKYAVILLACLLAIGDIMVGRGLLRAADGGSGGDISTGKCLAPEFLFTCGQFTCSGFYYIAENGICFILPGYCKNRYGAKDKSHECSTYLW